MSNRAFVCSQCGSLRRREAGYLERDGSLPDTYPRCCSAPMEELTKGYAEAATKLDAPERVVWLAAGGHIIRKPGRKWTAAVSEREIAIARDQLARHLGDDVAAT